MATEAENIKNEFADFFKAKQKLSRSSKVHASRNRPHGWFDEFRADAFATPEFGNILLKEGGIWPKLIARIYNVHSIGEVSVVLAYYGDGKILWLDDHASDDDFKKFFKTERLWEWLPEQIEDFAALLIETKLNYLGNPHLIKSKLDIPSFSKQDLEQLSGDENAKNQLNQAQENLERVSEKITAPNLLVEHRGTFELTICVWTKILGRVIDARFKFGNNGFFFYEGYELVEQVGRFLVPR